MPIIEIKPSTLIQGPPITRCDSVYGPGGADNFNRTGIGGNPYPYGECTFLCWQYFHDLKQVDIDGHLGDAWQWVQGAHRAGYAVDQAPAASKIIVWSATKYPSFGHVAICTGGDASGFTVVEMNFTYFAGAGHPELAGKIDCRSVPNMDGVIGCITPTGVTAGGGSPGNSLLDALAAPMHGIADAIKQAALYAQAELMTAELKAASASQIGAGLTIMGGGGVLSALTLAGGGSPAQGLARARTLARTATNRSSGQSAAQDQDVPSGAAERLWLPKNHRGRTMGAPPKRPGAASGGAPGPLSSNPGRQRQDIPRRRAPAGRRPVAESALNKILSGRNSAITSAEAAWVKANPDRVREALMSAGRR